MDTIFSEKIKNSKLSPDIAVAESLLKAYRQLNKKEFKESKEERFKEVDPSLKENLEKLIVDYIDAYDAENSWNKFVDSDKARAYSDELKALNLKRPPPSSKC